MSEEIKVGDYVKHEDLSSICQVSAISKEEGVLTVKHYSRTLDIEECKKSIYQTRYYRRSKAVIWQGMA